MAREVGEVWLEKLDREKEEVWCQGVVHEDSGIGSRRGEQDNENDRNMRQK